LNLYAALLNAGEKVTYPIKPDRALWVQVARGTAIVNGETLTMGDAAAIEAEPTLELIGQENAEILVFDLA
ncbi:MAG TPA: pirin family protein, partial [Leptolyngbya sp.]|nr:pirin family protein [Leptolyngbya sp.]